MLIDSHCHVNIMIRNYLTKDLFISLSNNEINLCKEIVNNALFNDVSIIINVGTDLVESLTCIHIAKNFSNCYASIGLHPSDVKMDWQEIVSEFKELLKRKKDLKIVGIGECGIDKYHQGYDLKLQKKAFESQIELAIENNLAIIVHCRQADIETYETLYQYKNEANFKGVIHCFSSDLSYAKKYLDLGFVLGFGGAITYKKNEELRNVVLNVPLEKIILETDAPFLPPQNIRGKQNSPEQIQTIAKFIATLKNISYEQVSDITFKNTKDLFGL